MNAFAAATAALFRDPNLTVAALYSASGGAPYSDLRVMRAQPDADVTFGSSRAVVETVVIEARMADLATPAKGDVFVIDSVSYVISAAPMADRERTTWRISLNRQVF